MSDFVIELKDLINRFSVENDSDTPDFILARYIQNCLDAYAVATRARDDWYKPKQEPGSNVKDEPQGISSFEESGGIMPCRFDPLVIFLRGAVAVD